MKKEDFIQFIEALQTQICSALETEDGGTHFERDQWQREGGGGGLTRVIQNGKVFEKGGVNTSEVYGPINTTLREQLNVKGENFYACGISLVLHPFSPMIPTVHANYRYFEVYDMNGKVLQTAAITQTITTINMEALKAATYIIKVFNNQLEVTSVVIIKK